MSAVGSLRKHGSQRHRWNLCRYVDRCCWASSADGHILLADRYRGSTAATTSDDRGWRSTTTTTSAHMTPNGVARLRCGSVHLVVYKQTQTCYPVLFVHLSCVRVAAIATKSPSYRRHRNCRAFDRSDWRGCCDRHRSSILTSQRLHNS